MSAHQKDTVDKTTKPAESKANIPEFDPAQTYTIIGTGKGKHLLKGNEYPVSGADAKSLIENGHATLKDK